MSDIIVNLIDGDDINVSVTDPAPINVSIAPDSPIVVVTVAEQGPAGNANVLYGTTDPPDPALLPDGTLYIKY